MLDDLRTLDRRHLEERYADLGALAGVREVRLAGGRADGVEVLEVRTGSGLCYDVLAGRGMDIGRAEFRGIPISWRSPTGDVAATHFESADLGWLRSFHGGLLVGCGLRHVGARPHDDEQELGLHGRVSNTPAERVTVTEGWVDGAYRMEVTGQVREARVLGEHITMTRTIRSWLGRSEIEIEDVVENRGFDATPHMFLYHMNVGFPVVSEMSRFVAPVITTESRDGDRPDPLTSFVAPSTALGEQVFFHTLAPDEDGIVRVGITRRSPEPLGVAISYPLSDFPYFTQWRVMRPGTYAVGLEPGNCHVEGMRIEREKGRLQELGPRETRAYRLSVQILTSEQEIDDLEASARRAEHRASARLGASTARKARGSD